MSRLVRLACEQLLAELAPFAPELLTKVAIQAPPDADVPYPALAILPDRFKLQTQQPELVRNPDGTAVVLAGQRALMEVGALRGSVRIWIGARLPAQREAVEDKVRTAFLQDDIAMGRLLVTLADVEVGGERTGADWPVAFFLDDEEWHEEMVFSEKRWSYMRVLVDIPVLTQRLEAWPVHKMIVAITHDITTPITSPSDVATPPLGDLRENTVNPDGTIGPPP